MLHCIPSQSLCWVYLTFENYSLCKDKGQKVIPKAGIYSPLGITVTASTRIHREESHELSTHCILGRTTQNRNEKH